MKHMVPYHHYSNAYYELEKNGTLEKILDAKTRTEEIEIINSYIAKNYPQYFRGYQCIKDEYDLSHAKAILVAINNKIIHGIPPSSDYNEKMIPLENLGIKPMTIIHSVNNTQSQPQQSAQVQITTDDNVDPDIRYALNCIKHEEPQPVGPINLPIMGLNCKLMPQDVPEDEPTDDGMQYGR